MKKILLVIILFSTYLTSQNIRIEYDENDDFNGNRTIETAYQFKKWPKKSDFIDTNNELVFSLKYIKSPTIEKPAYLLNFIINSSVDLGCLSEYEGKIILLLENGLQIECFQISKTSCSNYPSASYVFDFRRDVNLYDAAVSSSVYLKEIQKSPLKKIRIFATNGYKDYEIKSDKRNIITEHYNAIQKIL